MDETELPAGSKTSNWISVPSSLFLLPEGETPDATNLELLDPVRKDSKRSSNRWASLRRMFPNTLIIALDTFPLGAVKVVD